MTLPQLEIIPAGAGSGKTYTIQKRLAGWIGSGLVQPDRIVAVTFTEAAATELRDRIRAELIASGRLEDALKLDQAYISTIHGFGLRLLSEFAFDAGYNPTPRLLTEDEQKILVRLALAETDRAMAVMKDLYRYGYRYDFNSGEGPEEAFRKRVLGLIGKLRAIGRREHCPELTRAVIERIRAGYGATASAANLKKRLLEAIDDFFQHFPEDISGLCQTRGVQNKVGDDYRILSRARSGDRLDYDWALWNKLRQLQTSTARNPLPEPYDQKIEAIMAAAEGLLEHPGPLADATGHAEALMATAAESMAHYSNEKNRRGLLDYTDMLALALDLLTLHPEVLAVLRERIQCLVIDEFQDTNPLQFALLWALHQAGVPTLIVGDLKQAIMGFQDADSRLLAELQNQFHDCCRPLESNYRSRSEIMDLVNEIGTGLFGSAYDRLEPKATFPSKLSPFEVIDFPRRSSAAIRAQHTVARIKALLDDENQQVFDKRSKSTRRLRGGDIAVLCPRHSDLERYAACLRQLGIRTRIESGGWMETREIEILLQALNYVADPGDRYAALYLAVTELGEETLAEALTAMLEGNEPTSRILQELTALRNSLHDALPAEVIEAIIDRLHLYDRICRWPEADQVRANILKLIDEAHEFATANTEALASGGYYGSGVKTFIAWLRGRNEREEIKQPEARVRDEDAVVLSTWHSSKGREWPVVVLCNLDKNATEVRLPSLDVNYTDFSDLTEILHKARVDISPAYAAREKNEPWIEQLRPGVEDTARRLLYVILTRAREKLILEWPSFLDNGNARENLSHWELLVAETGLELAGTQLRIHDKAFDCRVVQADKNPPPEFEEEQHTAPTLLAGYGRRALKAGTCTDRLTPEVVNASLLATDATFSVATQTYAYSETRPLLTDLDAIARGNLLHRAFETGDKLASRDLLERATNARIDETTFVSLKRQIDDFNGWLTSRLEPEACYREVPFLYLNEQGSCVNGFIDLLVETSEGFWILDHKSDQNDNLEERFGHHYPQLQCYAQAVATLRPDKPVLGVGINWVSYGKATLAEAPLP